MTERDTAARTSGSPSSSPSPRSSRVSRIAGTASVTLLVLAGTALTISTAYRARLRLGNIDGISYMSIARQYAHGWFGDAVNAYWSPMISWLMAPLIGFGIGPQIAFLTVNVATVTAVLGVAAWLTWSETRRIWAVLFVVLVLIPFGMSNVAQQSPDMLVVLWMLCFVWTLRFVDRHRSGSPGRRIASGVLLGAVGALGYETKLYLVPVFAVTTIVWLVARRADDRRTARMSADATPDRVRASRTVTVRATLLRAAVVPVAALAAFVIVAGPWITVVSVKYDEFTLGTSLQTNLASKFGPADISGHDAAPTLPAPPNPRAVSPGEDRTASVFDPGASSSTSRSGSADRGSTSLAARAGYYLGQRLLALPFYVARIDQLAPFAVPIGLLAASAWVLRLLTIRRAALACSVALATLVYAAGYGAITTAAGNGGDTRYYWPLLVLTTLLAGVLLPRILDAAGWRRPVRAGLVVVAAAAVVTSSFSQHWLGQSAPFVASTSAATPLDVFGPTTRPWGSSLVAAMRRDDAVPAGSRIVGTNLRETTSLAFLLGAHVYGRSGEHYDYRDPRFVRLLDAARIDYLLEYTPASRREADFSSVGEVVGSYVDHIPCTDTAGAPAVECRVDVVRLSGSR